MRFLGFLMMVGYLALGFMQLSATMTGLQDVWGWPWIFAAPVAFLTAYIPLLGTVAGMVGAVYGWGWSWAQAGVLFFGPFIVIAGIYVVMSVADKVRSRAGLVR